MNRDEPIRDEVVNRFTPPEHLTEEWIDEAVKDLNSMPLTFYEDELVCITLVKARYRLEEEEKMINYLLQKGKDVSYITELFSIPIEKVLAIQEELNKN